MTTRLSGEKTKFLPYNKAIRNPIDTDGYRVSYLWKEILNPTSMLDILENFVVEVEEKENDERDEQCRIRPRYTGNTHQQSENPKRNEQRCN